MLETIKKSVEKVSKACVLAVDKLVQGFPQVARAATSGSGESWKSANYARLLPTFPPAEYTHEIAELSPVNRDLFHNFHRAYYDYYDLFNKKGHA